MKKSKKEFLIFFENSIAFNYLKELYSNGVISTDIYDTILYEDEEKLKLFDNIKDERKIKIKILDYIMNLGGISTDAYDMELNEL